MPLKVNGFLPWFLLSLLHGWLRQDSFGSTYTYFSLCLIGLLRNKVWHMKFKIPTQKIEDFYDLVRVIWFAFYALCALPLAITAQFMAGNSFSRWMMIFILIFPFVFMGKK